MSRLSKASSEQGAREFKNKVHIQFVCGMRIPFITWTSGTRHKIITDIAREVLYLDQEQGLQSYTVTSKQLNMNPKVSNFGMARIMRMNQNQSFTLTLIKSSSKPSSTSR